MKPRGTEKELWEPAKEGTRNGFQRQRDEKEPSLGQESFEAEDIEIRSWKLEGILVVESQLKRIRGSGRERKYLCPKWAGILLEKHPST